MDKVELFIFAGSLLLVLCVLFSQFTGKLGIPVLVVFLGIGMLAGSEGIGGIYFDNAYYTKIVGVVALSYILFSGGLGTNWNEIRPVLKSSLSLSTLGVIINSLVVGYFTHYFFNFSLIESFLIGAIISSTDAGAVFTVLRARKINLKEKLRSLLEVESGSNDPMAVFLVTTLILIFQNSDYSLWRVFPKAIVQLLMGGVIGLIGGWFLLALFRKLKLEIEGLATVLSLAMVLMIYTLSQFLEGNGFLSVYVAGVYLGRENFYQKKTLINFHDGISWLMQSCMFLTLGLLIFPSHLKGVLGSGIFIALFMIFIARPISVFISLSFSDLNWREKLFISWVGLRGAVPIVMATYPLVAGIERADTIFNLVFFVAVSSLLFQGTTISWVAKILGVDKNETSGI